MAYFRMNVYIRKLIFLLPALNSFLLATVLLENSCAVIVVVLLAFP